jgi:folate-dependent phosphoribosylglycinamide formyltransferase PurN
LTGKPIKLGWFSTGRGEGSYGLLKAAVDAIDSGVLDAEIGFVFCNREKGQAAGSDRFMAFVEERGIPLVTLSSRSFRREHGGAKWSELREKFDEAVLKLIEPFKVDLTVNAGYMLIAPLLCRETLMINLHPALPDGPAGMWQGVIWDLIDARATETGAMVHIVTEEVDGGPVLAICRFPLAGSEWDALWREVGESTSPELKDGSGEDLPLFKAVREKGLVRERPLIVESLRAIADGRIDLELAADRGPVDLTDAVEAALETAPA